MKNLNIIGALVLIGLATYINAELTIKNTKSLYNLEKTLKQINSQVDKTLALIESSNKELVKVSGEVVRDLTIK
jgi:hypothetical protein